jgi:predicted RNA-binding protein YlxR (DUF448 family)
VTSARGRGGNDGGAARELQRQCALSRARKPPEELIRFVAAPDGSIVPDLARRLPGRGVWIEASAAAVAAAVRRNIFARSLKRQVTAPADLSEQVERLLRRRLAAALAIANKAGLITAGYVKVGKRLRGRAVFVLLHAAEASPVGAARLDHLFKTLSGSAWDAQRVIRELTSAELSLAIGQPTVVHAAAAAGGASARLLAEALRLRGYRQTPCPGEAVPRPAKSGANAGGGTAEAGSEGCARAGREARTKGSEAQQAIGEADPDTS